MTPKLYQYCKLRTGKLIQLKAITGKRVAYRGCNLKKRGLRWITLLEINTERIFIAKTRKKNVVSSNETNY